jgi:hypothetical protein
MRIARRLLTLTLALGMTLALGGVASADACKDIDATGIGQDLGGGNTTATIDHGGPLNGTTSGHFVISGSPPVFTIAGTVVFTTKHGTLTATVTGTFDVATGAFTASGPVTAGTGKLAGATGILTFAGVENLATGAFTETITGTICGLHDRDNE